MFATLVIAIVIAVTAQRASGRVSEYAAELMRSERRLAIREVLRESDEPDDVQQAFEDALRVFRGDPAELRIAERLYYSNPAVPLDEFAEAYTWTTPSGSLLQAVGQSFARRFDGQAVNEVLRAARNYAHMRSPDEASQESLWRIHPASIAANYVAQRLEGQPYDGQLGSLIHYFMGGGQPRVSQSILSCLANAQWQPLECKLELATGALDNLDDDEVRVDARGAVHRYLTESPVPNIEQLTAPEADALENFTLTALQYVIHLAGQDPAGSADFVSEVLPGLDESLQGLHRHWHVTNAAAMRRLGQFDPIWRWWNKRLATFEDPQSDSVAAITDLLHRLHTPERRAMLDRMRASWDPETRDADRGGKSENATLGEAPRQEAEQGDS